MTGQQIARVHHQHGGAMNGRIGSHRVQKGDIVHTLPNVGKEIRHMFPTLPVLLKLPLGPDHPAFVAVPSPTKGFYLYRFPIERIQFGLVIKGIHVAGPTVHK